MATGNDVTQQYMTVTQVATILGVSHDTVLRRLGGMDGVIDLGSGETTHKRRRRELRIPQRALDRFLISVRVKVRQK